MADRIPPIDFSKSRELIEGNPEKFDKMTESLGDYVLDKTNSPILAALAKTSADVAPMVLMHKAGGPKGLEEVSATPHVHQEVLPEEFHKVIQGIVQDKNPIYKANITPYSKEDYSKFKTYLSPDRKSGYAVKPDGELVSVFSKASGRGESLVDDAVLNKGAKKLDAFDINNKLPSLYGKYMDETSRMNFADEYAPKDWDYTKLGRPDVVNMGLNPEKINQIQSKKITNYAKGGPVKSWDTEPPTKEEMNWSDAPPTPEELASVGKHPTPMQAHPAEQSSMLQTLKDALTGAGEMTGISQQVGGAAQAVPNAVQSLLHEYGLADRSPTQINEALASMGIKGDVGPTSSAQMYNQGTKDVQQQQEEAVKRSPIAYRAGEAGGLGLSAVATGGLAPELVGVSKGAPVAAKMAAGALNAMPVGAAYGALNAQGSLIGGSPEEQKQVLESAATGSLVGGGLGAATAGIGAGLGKLAKTEMGKNLVERYKIGKEGKNLGSEESQFGSLSNPQSLDTALSQHETRVSNQILDGLNQIDENLGKDVGKSLSEATEKGVRIKGDPGINQQIETLSQNLPEIGLGSAEEAASSSPVYDKLKKQGELAIEKERLLGNHATYEIVPSNDQDGNRVLNLMIKKQGKPGIGEKLVKKDIVPIEEGPEGLLPEAINPEENVPQGLEVSPENYGGEDVTIKNQHEAIATPVASEPLEKNLSFYAQKLKTSGLTPNEIWQFRNDLGQMGKTLKNSSNAQDRLVAAEVFKTVNTLGGLLKQNVPDYGHAAIRMEEFRRLMPETILSKDNPVDVTALRMSGTRNVDTKLLNNAKKMIKGLYTGDEVAQGSFTNLLKGMQELNTNEMQRKTAGRISKTVFDDLGMQPADVENFIKQQAGRSKVLQQYSSAPNLDVGKALSQPVALATKGAGYVAEKAGNMSAGKNPILNTGTKLYNASDETLKNFAANTLTRIPGQDQLAAALTRAIEHKDPVAKNAVLFSIMQNPNLRNLVESNNLELEPR